jgi:hypothetical protein
VAQSLFMKELRELDIWEQLLIRACKSNTTSENIFFRILAKRSRIGLKSVKDPVGESYLIERLATIVEDFEISSLRHLLQEIAYREFKCERFKFSSPTASAVIHELIKTIRFCEPAETFKNYRVPTKFKRL